jgi:galactonate dehydratase
LANIKRGLRRRSRVYFAETAAAAVAAGFTAVKCAPFDGLDRAGRLAGGLARVRAVRAAIGPDVALMVDAHHQIGVRDVLAADGDFAALGLRWLEDVTVLDDLAALAALRVAQVAPLAGGELAFDPAEVTPALAHLDYLMPDVKHAGGPSGALRLAAAAHTAGVRVSLHNPSGPVGTMASLHVAVAAGGSAETEYAYGEAAWRSQAVRPAEQAGPALLVPPGAGLGVRLNEAAGWREVEIGGAAA